MSVLLNASVVFITDACHSGKLGSDNRCTCPASNDLIKAPGIIRIGVYAPQGDDQVNQSELQQHMAMELMTGKIEAVT